MIVKINCRMVACKQTKKGSYKCVMLTPDAESFLTYVKKIDEADVSEYSQLKERSFALSNDSVLFLITDEVNNRTSFQEDKLSKGGE